MKIEYRTFTDDSYYLFARENVGTFEEWVITLPFWKLLRFQLRRRLEDAYNNHLRSTIKIFYKAEDEIVNAELVPYIARIHEVFGQDGWFVKWKDSTCGCRGIHGQVQGKYLRLRRNCSPIHGTYGRPGYGGAYYEGQIAETYLSKQEAGQCMDKYDPYAIEQSILFEKVRSHPLFAEPLRKREEAEKQKVERAAAESHAQHEKEEKRRNDEKEHNESNKKIVLG